MVITPTQTRAIWIFSKPFNKVGIRNPYGKTLFPDVDGLHHSCVSQLLWHIVHIKNTRKLNVKMSNITIRWLNVRTLKCETTELYLDEVRLHTADKHRFAPGSERQGRYRLTTSLVLFVRHVTAEPKAGEWLTPVEACGEFIQRLEEVWGHGGGLMAEASPSPAQLPLLDVSILNLPEEFWNHLRNTTHMRTTQGFLLIQYVFQFLLPLTDSWQKAPPPLSWTGHGSYSRNYGPIKYQV